MCSRSPVISRDEVHQFPIKRSERAERSATQSGRALDDRVEGRLHVGRRLADDAQNLAGRGLSGKGIGKVRVAHLEFLKQPHVLDGYHRLVGKHQNEADLLLVERFYVCPAELYRTDSRALS